MLNDSDYTLTFLARQKHIEALKTGVKNQPRQKKREKTYSRPQSLNPGIEKSSDLKQQCAEVLQQIREKYPQTEINGFRNVWIIKPAGLSRGRGIDCYNSLQEIDNHIHQDGEWIA